MAYNYNTINQCLLELVKHAPGKKIIGDEVRWYTTSEFLHSTRMVAKQLSDFGIKKGEHIAISADRSVETMFVIWGIRLLGAIAVLTDPHKEIDTFLSNCNVNIPLSGSIFHQSAGSFVLIQNEERNSILINQSSEIGDLWEYPEEDSDIDTPGFIIFTSGSTGKNKAVVLSDRNVINNLIDSDPLGDYHFDDIALGALPLDHIFGLVLAVGTVVHGYSVYFPARTDVESILSAIEKEHITRMNGVPSLYLAMAGQASSHDLSSLRVGFIGGAPAPENVFIEIENALNMILVPVYGMSECIGISCGHYQDSQHNRACSVGRYYKNNNVIILDENNNIADVMEEGEICVKGPFRMIGYYPDKLDREEYFHTGDLGYLNNEGFLIISGRKKDIIIRNGKNLSTKKIEDALLTLPEVSQAAVVGLPDDKAGEVPYAMVVGIIDPADLKVLLPKNEIPAGFMCVESLPLTSSGKVDKLTIKENLLSWKNG